MNIIEFLKKHKNEIRKRFGGRRIGVFGSCARRQETKSIDIDLVVEFDQRVFGKNFKGLYDNYLDLTAYLESLLHRKVDIPTPVSIETIRIKEVAQEIKRSIVYV